MVEAVMLWNEPNNLSHWDFHVDPEWKIFAEMTIAAAREIRRVNPTLAIVLGGLSPIDPNFVKLLGGYGVLDAVDVVAIHGFPLDWNHWSIHDWPRKIEEIREVTNKPVWVSEAGVSSFGAEEVQVFGIERTAQLLLPLVDRVHWYSLYDLPATWTATTRHKEAEGSAYYRHYYMACCVKMARLNWLGHIFHKAWGFASGFILKIIVLSMLWGACGNLESHICERA